MKKSKVIITASMSMMGLLLTVTGCGSVATNSNSSISSKSANSSNTSNGSNAPTKSGNSNKSTGTKNITLAWWTHDPLTQQTMDAIKTFEQQFPDVKVTPNYASWSGYWTKLSTEYAAGSPPDVIQNSTSYLVAYVNKGQLLSLNNLSPIKLNELDQSVLPSGEVNGKLYGIPTGINAQAWLVNSKLLKKSGVNFDSSKSYSWADFAKLCEQISKSLSGVYGVSNAIGDSDLLLYYARDHGETLLEGTSKSLGISQQTLTAWFTYWLDMQENGGTPPAQVTATTMNANFPQTPMGKGQTVFQRDWTDDFVEANTALNTPISLAMFPGWGDATKPYYLHPSMYWSISSSTKDPQAAAELLNFLESDPQANKDYAFQRGFTINVKDKAMLTKTADSGQKSQIAFLNEVAKVASPLGPSAPAFSQFGTQLQNIGQEVLYKKLSPSKAAAELISMGKQDISNS